MGGTKPSAHVGWLGEETDDISDQGTKTIGASVHTEDGDCGAVCEQSYAARILKVDRHILIRFCATLWPSVNRCPYQVCYTTNCPYQVYQPGVLRFFVVKFNQYLDIRPLNSLVYNLGFSGFKLSRIVKCRVKSSLVRPSDFYFDPLKRWYIVILSFLIASVINKTNRKLFKSYPFLKMLRCFNTVFGRPSWYFSIALKMILSL